MTGFGAEHETRTRDPNLGKVVLYQLSYFRIIPEWDCKGTKIFQNSKLFQENLEFSSVFVLFCQQLFHQRGYDSAFCKSSQAFCRNSHYLAHVGWL